MATTSNRFLVYSKIVYSHSPKTVTVIATSNSLLVYSKIAYSHSAKTVTMTATSLCLGRREVYVGKMDPLLTGEGLIP